MTDTPRPERLETMTTNSLDQTRQTLAQMEQQCRDGAGPEHCPTCKWGSDAPLCRDCREQLRKADTLAEARRALAQMETHRSTLMKLVIAFDADQDDKLLEELSDARKLLGLKSSKCEMHDEPSCERCDAALTPAKET